MQELMFTDKEIQVARMKLQGLMNKEIAETLGVSDADISQTLSRLTGKVKTVQDSTELLMKMGVIQEGPRYVLTKKGRKLARFPKKKIYLPRRERRPVRLVVWHDFETDITVVSSGMFVELIPCHSYTVGQEEPIPLSGMSETTMNTLKKKTVRTLSTSEPTQPIEAPEKAVFT